MSHNKIKEILSNQGIKLTRERSEIINEIFKLNTHFNPEDLFISLKNQGSKVSRASVYRTIAILLSSNLIERVEKFDNNSHYEIIFGKKHHDHLICMDCGKVIEFYSPSLEVMQREICQKHDFAPIKHTLEIYGKCSECINRKCSECDRKKEEQS
jgi:Fur family ferric uptake transcriptional regulator